MPLPRTAADASAEADCDVVIEATLLVISAPTAADALVVSAVETASDDALLGLLPHPVAPESRLSSNNP
jgi:hypothetical protein